MSKVSKERIDYLMKRVKIIREKNEERLDMGLPPLGWKGPDPSTGESQDHWDKDMKELKANVAVLDDGVAEYRGFDITREGGDYVAKDGRDTVASDHMSGLLGEIDELLAIRADVQNSLTERS